MKFDIGGKCDACVSRSGRDKIGTRGRREGNHRGIFGNAEGQLSNCVPPWSPSHGGTVAVALVVLPLLLMSRASLASRALKVFLAMGFASEEKLPPLSPQKMAQRSLTLRCIRCAGN
jgi:hypothetical protein